VQCVNVQMLEEVFQQCCGGRAADDMAKGNQKSST
jgi:hypothetical protein